MSFSDFKVFDISKELKFQFMSILKGKIVKIVILDISKALNFDFWPILKAKNFDF